MLSLSLLAIPGALFQLLVSLNPAETFIIDLVDWAIVSIFILEYLVKLYLAASRAKYLRARWNLLNLFVMILAFGGAITSLPLLYSSPLLRVFRVTKLLSESRKTSHDLHRARPGFPNSQTDLRSNVWLGMGHHRYVNFYGKGDKPHREGSFVC